jgi:hypothetical protein
MKIVFVDKISKAKKIGNSFNEIIFSLNPSCSYVLKKRKIVYYDYSNFYNHELEWKNYSLYNSRTEKISKILDAGFHKFNFEYKDIDWKIFGDFSFIIKTWYDTLLLHSKILGSIVLKFEPQILEFSKETNIEINQYFLIDNVSNIIEILAKHNLNVKIKYYNSEENINYSTPFSFGQPTKLLKNLNFTYKTKIYNFICNLKNYYNIHFKKINYLGVGCDEISCINNSKNPGFYNISPHKYQDNNKLNEAFIVSVEKSLNQLGYFKHEGLSFLFFFLEIVKFLFCKTEFYYQEYKRFNKLAKKIQIKTIIFQTMSPFYYPVFIFRKIAELNNIPFFTWTHGGYFTISNPGYDVVDYKFCVNHIGYGKYLNELLENKKININKINKKKYNIYPVGSFKFDKIHRRINFKKNKKKIITYFIGCEININSFYFGYNRKNIVTSIWQQQLEIIKTLYKFSNEYEIIVKGYPNGISNLWNVIIKKEFSNKIKYISNQRTIAEVLTESDLNIFPWISTTFFEALYYNADICLFDEDLYIDPFKKKFSNEIIFSKDFSGFQKKIFNYLNKGVFYRFDKKVSRDYFLSYSDKKRNKIITLKNIMDIAYENSKKKNYIKTRN